MQTQTTKDIEDKLKSIDRTISNCEYRLKYKNLCEQSQELTKKLKRQFLTKRADLLRCLTSEQKNEIFFKKN